MTPPNKDNPAVPSHDAMTPEQIHQITQENQDRNRPDQNQKAQQGQKRVINDSSAPGYGLTDPEDGEARKNGLDNQNDRVDNLGDSQ